MEPNLLSIAFTLIYTFAFREATKRAAGWGAFQFPADNKDLRRKKFLCTSLPILGGLPLLFYWLSLKVISQHSIDTGDRFLVGLLWMIPLIALLGFFPRTAKNLWNLVAHYKGQPREGWINKGMESDLPRLTYSWQVVVLLGTAQVGLLLYMLLSQQVSFDNFIEKDLPQLFVMFYVSEMIVLHHRAKSLNYFYPEANPKALLAWRTIPSVFVSVLSPIIFAILCSPWVLWLTDANDCCFWVGLGLSLLGLLFPIYCNNLLLLIGIKRNWWKHLPEPPPESKGPTWYWILGLVSIVAFVLVTLPNCKLYTSYSKKVFNLAQTFVEETR